MDSSSACKPCDSVTACVIASKGRSADGFTCDPWLRRGDNF